MQFLIRAYDGKDMLEKRMEVRPRHLEGMKAFGKQIICAGGLLDEDGKMKGSPNRKNKGNQTQQSLLTTE